MMKRFCASLCILAMTGFSLLAEGNPMSCENFKARQVPGSRHVQLSFVTICTADIKSRSVTRDGEAIKTDWQEYKGFVANMGSGLETGAADQICDCDVPVGAHEFKLTYKVKYDDETSDQELTQTVEVQDPAALAEQETETEGVLSDAGDTDKGTEEMMPWDEPEPEGIQGLDCIAACKTGGPGTESAASTESDSGCTAAPGLGHRDGLPLLLSIIGVLSLWFLGKGGNSR